MAAWEQRARSAVPPARSTRRDFCVTVGPRGVSHLHSGHLRRRGEGGESGHARVGAPDDFATSADVLQRALDSPTFTGWMTLPCGRFVADAGIDHPRGALALLAGLTPRWSSEFALRPFIERHPHVTFEHLYAWVDDADEHVRRLVSEGTRPRLPWAPHLLSLIEDPTPTIPLLSESRWAPISV